MPQVQNTLWAAAQKFSSSLGEDSWREHCVCAGGLSPRGTSAQFTPTQKQKKNKLHLCIKFFSKAAGVLWREWMLRFTRSSKVEVEALSSLKLLQEKKEKKSSSSQTSHHFQQGSLSPSQLTTWFYSRKQQIISHQSLHQKNWIAFSLPSNRFKLYLRSALRNVFSSQTLMPSHAPEKLWPVLPMNEHHKDTHCKNFPSLESSFSSSLSSSYWQRPYTKQTRTYHVGPDIFFASGCGSIHPSAISGKTPGSEVQLEIF